MQALAEGERGEVAYGQAFDIKAERRQVDFDSLGSSNRSYETGYEITLRNARPSAVVVDVIEQFNGDWRISQKACAM